MENRDLSLYHAIGKYYITPKDGDLNDCNKQIRIK